MYYNPDPDSALSLLFSRHHTELFAYSNSSIAALRWGVEMGYVEKVEGEEYLYRLTEAGKEKYAR